MRRADREMDREFAYYVVDKSEFGVIATVGIDGLPYAVPVSVARDGDVLYIHGACEGRKIGNIRGNSNVSIAFVGDVEVPPPIEESEFEIAKDAKVSLGKLVSKKFTTEFESAVVFGKAYEVEDEKTKIHGLRLISEKYTPENMPYFDSAIEVSLERTCVVRVEIESITGKRKKYDSAGEEMKWGRLE